MSFRNNHRISLTVGMLAATAALVVAPAWLNADEDGVPDRIDLSNFPGEIVDKVVVPIPAEIFAVLDKLDEPEWKGAINMPESNETTTDRAILALTFGSLVGEGFIAVQAQSGEDIQQIGRRVLALAKSLSEVYALPPHGVLPIGRGGDRVG